MDFKSKIDRVLAEKKIKLWKLAQDSGIGSTLEKAYEENREMRDTSTDKLLKNAGISAKWWTDQEGQVVTEPPEGMESEEVYKTIVEGKTEYLLIPRSVLQEKYRIVALEQFEMDKTKLAAETEKDKTQADKDQLFINALIEANRILVRQLDALIPKTAQM